MSANESKCPKCGEYAPSNCLICPKCYANIPRDNLMEKERRFKKPKPGKSMRVALILSTFPALFGLLGLGKIYLDSKDRRGYWFLLGGLILYMPIVALFLVAHGSGLLSALFLTLVMIILLLVYFSATVAVFIETMIGSVFKVMKF